MVNYSNGKVYKIESHLGDKVYYGSTTKKYLSQRMDKHRGDYKQWLEGKCNLVMSYKMFEEYGIENCKIVLIENCPCESKDELTSRESYYIRNFDCVNKNIPGRTNKEWREDNRVKLVEYKNQYLEDNKERIREISKQYREDNKESLSEKKKEYYHANKDKILEQMKEKYTCECGVELCKSNKSNHVKSKKHINFINNQ